MTTTLPATVDWIRLTIGDEQIELVPSPDVQLRLAVEPVEYEGYLDPLTAGPPTKLYASVDLVPLNARAVHRCEARAGEAAGQLGVYEPATSPLREFALEAGLSGEGLPYNRVAAPRLHLVPGPPPMFDEDQPVPSVRVFTAHLVPDLDGTCWLTRTM